MATLTINTNGKTDPMSKLPKDTLIAMKETLEEFAYGDGVMTREQLSEIIKTLGDNLTEAGQRGETGLAITGLYDTIEGKSGRISDSEGGRKPTSPRTLQTIANVIISALDKIIPSMKGGRRRRINRSVGRRGKSRRRGNTRRQRR
jgi:hypothetical protein